MSLKSKLSEVSKEVGLMEMGGRNDFHGYKYAKAADIILKVNRALAERGILMLASDTVTHVLNDGGLVFVESTLTFYDTESDETLVSKSVGSGSDKGDKAVMKAATAAYKYALAHAFTMAWGAEDPEADADTDKAAASNETATRESSGASRRGGTRGGGRGRRKASEPEKTVEEVAKDIEAAESIEELEKLRSAVLAFRGKDAGYSDLVDLFRNKTNSLKGE